MNAKFIKVEKNITDEANDIKSQVKRLSDKLNNVFDKTNEQIK